MRIPGQGPHVPPPIAPKEAKPVEEAKPEARKPAPPPPREGIAKGPEFDARAIAVRMAALASEAKEKELSFEEIVQRAIDETGMTNPEAALEEANRRTQKEIEDILEQIKSNKDLMDESEAWQTFGEVLSRMSEEQVSGFLDILQAAVRGKSSS